MCFASVDVASRIVDAGLTARMQGMHLHRTALGLVVEAPAKLNLFFEVLGRRDDGYHEIETLVYPIDLYDTLYFREDLDGPIELGCERDSRAQAGCGALGTVPEGRENLVVRALELLRKRAGVARGATVRLVKRIPSEAGLGGGSSDAAAALAAANVLWELGWPPARLAELGAELGSDVPFFFTEGAALCRGRGEWIEPVLSTKALHFVMVRPPAGLSTAAVYAACKPPAAPRSSAAVRRALAAGDAAALGYELFNRLETAAEGLSPWIGRLRGELARADCLGCLMTGSGSSCFGLCRHARHARRLAERLQARGIGIAYPVRGSR